MEKCFECGCKLCNCVNLTAIAAVWLENMLNNMFFICEKFCNAEIGCTFVSVFMVKDFKVNENKLS